jgi:hypothetical protein
VDGIEFQNITSEASFSALKLHREKNGEVTASGTAGGRKVSAAAQERDNKFRMCGWL